MNILTGYCTDKGIKKEVNQDSIMLKIAHCSLGDVVMMAVCDGVGGLQMGELASASMIRMLGKWFREQLPHVLASGNQDVNIVKSIGEVIHEINEYLINLSEKNHMKLGTTLTCFLLVGKKYYVAHVGDTRLYEISDEIVQLTNDHTLVALEVSQGRLSEEDAKTDPRANILLQGIGTTKRIQPDYFSGMLKEGAVYLICCDGFRHKLSDAEIAQMFDPRIINTEKLLQNQCTTAVNVNKQRQEKDNISVVALKCMGDERC